MDDPIATWFTISHASEYKFKLILACCEHATNHLRWRGLSANCWYLHLLEWYSFTGIIYGELVSSSSMKFPTTKQGDFGLLRDADFGDSIPMPNVNLFVVNGWRIFSSDPNGWDSDDT